MYAEMNISDFFITKTRLFKYTENFTTKKWKFSDKTTDFFLGEAVLTSTHNLCFEQKYEKYQNFYLKPFSFWWWNFQYIWIGVFS